MKNLCVTYDNFLSQNLAKSKKLRKITVQSWKNDSTEVSELGLSQILREKIIVSNTQIFHQIIKIWHEIRHFLKV